MRRYLTLVNYLLITWAVYFSVDAFYRTSASMLQVADPQATAEKKSMIQDGEAVRPLSYYRPITERNLFALKEEEAPKIEPKLDVEELKQTELNLRLWGTVLGDEGDSYAVIEDAKDRSQNLYKIDDQIQNAVIKEIHREKVVLMVNGEYEILQMEEMKTGAPVRRAGLRQREAEAQRQVQPARSSISLKRENIESAVANLNSLMKQVRIRPHFKDGKPDGLTLSGVRAGSIFSEMGFRNGDVIVGVDGKNIESVDDALSLYQNLQSANSVQVQIRRRGRLQSIDYQIE